MPRELHVLILEDRVNDAELIVYELRRAGFDVHSEYAQTEYDYRKRLSSNFDLILADYTLPQFNALRALHLLQEMKLDIPFIVVTGSISEEIAVECMKEGAADYLLKDRLARLGLAVNHALEEKRLRDEKLATEVALRESEVRYREMFVKNNAIKLVIDPATGQIVDANPAACVFYGYAFEQFITMNILDIDVTIRVSSSATEPDCEGESEHNFIDDLISYVGDSRDESDEQHSYYVAQHRLASGEIRDIEAYSGPIEANGRKLLFAIIHDITERKSVEAALKHSEEHFRALIESSTELVVVSDETRRFTYVSPSFERVLGYQQAELMGYSWELIIHPDDLQFLRRIGRRILSSPGIAVPAEFRIAAKNGSWRIIESVFKNLLDDPAVKGIVGTARDITERRNMEREQLRMELLHVQIEKDKEMLALKERFTTTIAHDFRTPLAIILASSSSLQRYYGKYDGEARDQKFQEIVWAVDHMNAMVDDVIELGRLKSGKISSNPTQFNLETMCHNLINRFQLMNKGEHTFIYENETNLSDVLMDQKMLQRVLMNLVSNAVKYSPNGGEIRFTLGRDGTNIVFGISDQGIGIPEEDRKYLFQEFHRAKNAKGLEGTGLGLSIVKSYIDVCGGTIACQSIEGEGTTFTVWLPASAPVETPTT